MRQSNIGHELNRETMQKWLASKIRYEILNGSSKEEAVLYVYDLLDTYTLCPQCSSWIERSWPHQDWCPNCIIDDEFIESVEVTDEDRDRFVRDFEEENGCKVTAEEIPNEKTKS